MNSGSCTSATSWVGEGTSSLGMVRRDHYASWCLGLGLATTTTIIPTTAASSGCRLRPGTWPSCKSSRRRMSMFLHSVSCSAQSTTFTAHSVPPLRLPQSGRKPVLVAPLPLQYYTLDVCRPTHRPAHMHPHLAQSKNMGIDEHVECGDASYMASSISLLSYECPRWRPEEAPKVLRLRSRFHAAFQPQVIRPDPRP